MVADSGQGRGDGLQCALHRAQAQLSRRGLLAGLMALPVLGSTAACAQTAAAASAAAWPLPTPLDVPKPYPGSGLTPLGGLTLSDSVIGFGGLSALNLAPDLTLTAISDRGHWLQARLVLRDGRPEGLADLRSGPLNDGAGKPLPSGYAADAESLARLPDGTWLIGFERWHRIRAYARLDGPGRYVQAPPGLDKAPRNGGLESLAVLNDGRWLAIAEQLRGGSASAGGKSPSRQASGHSNQPAHPDQFRQAWLGRPGAWKPVLYQPTDPRFDPSDACPLPDGGALVLERHFDPLHWFSARLCRLRPTAFNAPVLIPELLTEMPVENWEGVSALQHEGQLLVATITDDNEFFLQHSRLLLFTLAS